jgi:hypothetical protein
MNPNERILHLRRELIKLLRPFVREDLNVEAVKKAHELLLVLERQMPAS